MMRPLLLSELEQPLGACLKGLDQSVSGVSTDSRAIGKGELFVALRGDKFDGHDYLNTAANAGAAAALVSTSSAVNIPLLEVKNTQASLGLLGAYNRSLFHGTVVAITGSGGKTTVKNMVASVLSQKGETLATKGNFNNEIGVPLTLLRLAPEHQFAVVEMGAARRGDIKWLVQLGRPSVAVLLNAMPAHLASFGTVADVAEAKAEIFSNVTVGDFAILNADQPWAAQWRENAGEATILDFGIYDSGAAIRATAIESRGFAGVSFTAHTPIGDFPVNLNLPGTHNVANALAAIAVAIACEVCAQDIQQGLAMTAAVSGRLAVVEAEGGATLIDDCYNAQPGSVKAAIDLLAESQGRRTLVLGAMKELGPDSEVLHIEVARYAKDAGIEQFWGVGPELQGATREFGKGGLYCGDRSAALEKLVGAFSARDTVLVKGSRSAGMEHVLAAIASDKSAGEH